MPQKTVYLKNLPEGDYTIAIRAIDMWGNKSPWSKSLRAYVDRGNPIVTNEFQVTSINSQDTQFTWSGVRDEGIGLCSTLFHNPEGFVLARSVEKNSPTFTIATGSPFSAQAQVFDCLGNGLTGNVEFSSDFISASKSARTGKWTPAGSSYPTGALRCTGKCSASFSTNGNVSAIIGQGSADLFVASKAAAKVSTSTSTTLRFSSSVSLGTRNKVVRVTGSNFVLAGLSKFNYKTGTFLPIARGPEFPDPSLEDATQRSLSNLGFRIGDFTDDWTVLPMARGTTLLDPTLDLCGASYPSEINRVARRQIWVTKVGSPYQFLSSESVRYSSANAATNAFNELRKSYEACVRNKGGTENGVFTNYEFQTLPGGSPAILSEPSRIIVRATLGSGISARQLFAVYQFQGSYFSGLYIVKSGANPIENSEISRWIRVGSEFSRRLIATTNSGN